MQATSAENIVYCITSVQQILDQQLDFVFTNGHAVEKTSTLFYPADVQAIEKHIDQAAINRQYWKDENDLDVKRRKEAEFLVATDLPPACILGFAVYNETAQNKLLNFGVTAEKIVIRSNYYF